VDSWREITVILERWNHFGRILVAARLRQRRYFNVFRPFGLLSCPVGFRSRSWGADAEVTHDESRRTAVRTRRVQQRPGARVHRDVARSREGRWLVRELSARIRSHNTVRGRSAIRRATNAQDRLLERIGSSVPHRPGYHSLRNESDRVRSYPMCGATARGLPPHSTSSF